MSEVIFWVICATACAGPTCRQAGFSTSDKTISSLSKDFRRSFRIKNTWNPKMDKNTPKSIIKSIKAICKMSITDQRLVIRVQRLVNNILLFFATIRFTLNAIISSSTPFFQWLFSGQISRKQ